MVKRCYHTVSVTIPINLTVDLGIAIKRHREKYLKKLKEECPELFPKETSTETKDSEASDPPPTKKKSNDIRKEDYASVVDYLEAKYARGVVPEEKSRKKQKVDKSQENNEDDEDDSSHEDDRSIYSRGSDGFIDDTELMTSVAEQVIASSRGMTKIEIEAAAKKKKDDDFDYDDDAFFVNIGPLEMEEGYDENDVSKIDFNALDKPNLLKTKKKKRKPYTFKTKETNTTQNSSTPTKQSDKSTPTKTKPQQCQAPTSTKKSNEKSTPTPNQNEKTSPPPPLQQPNPKTQQLYNAMISLKDEKDRLHAQVIAQTKELTIEHLPRVKVENVKLKMKKLPAGKKSGDEIEFKNPRNEKERLKVVIPSTYIEGEPFTADFRIPCPPSENDENKFPKLYKGLLDDYTRTYDGWIDAEFQYRVEMKCLGSFKPGNEKMKKFDDILPLFPGQLQTPVDGPYLRNLARKVRQNSSKRKQLNVEMKQMLKDSLKDNEAIETTIVQKEITIDNENAKPVTVGKETNIETAKNDTADKNLTNNDTADKDLTNNDTADKNDDEIDDDYDEPHIQADDNDGISPLTSKTNEPIRPGDIIEYHDPMFVAGDKRGLKIASVLSVDRKRTPILILSSGEVLPSDTNVRRIKVMFRNKLEDHPFGVFHRITDFQLKTAGTVVGSIVQTNSDRLEKTSQKHLDKSHEPITATASENTTSTPIIALGKKKK